LSKKLAALELLIEYIIQHRPPEPHRTAESGGKGSERKAGPRRRCWFSIGTRLNPSCSAGSNSIGKKLAYQSVGRSVGGGGAHPQLSKVNIFDASARRGRPAIQ